MTDFLLKMKNEKTDQLESYNIVQYGMIGCQE